MTIITYVKSAPALCGLVAVAALASAKAQASPFATMGGSICQQQGGDGEYNYGYMAYTKNETICPLWEDNGLARADLTAFVLYLEDNHASWGANAQLCRRSYDYSGGSCGSTYYTGAAFTGAVSADLGDLDESAWDSSQLGSAYVQLASSNASITSYRTRGYTAANSGSAHTPPTQIRGQAAYCTPEDHDDYTAIIGELSPGFSEGVYKSGEQSSYNELICPSLEQAGLGRLELTGIDIYGYDASGTKGVGFTLCRATSDGQSGTCGTEKISSNGFTGSVHYDEAVLDATAWGTLFGSTYIRVRVPQSADGAISYFSGYLLTSG